MTDIFHSNIRRAALFTATLCFALGCTQFAALAGQALEESSHSGVPSSGRQARPSPFHHQISPGTVVTSGEVKNMGGARLDSAPPLLSPVVTYATGGVAAQAVAVGDVNGDGKPDVVTVNENGSAEGAVGVLLGNGDGTFQPVALYDSGGIFTVSVTLADINGDGKLDIVAGNFWDPTTTHGVLGVLIGNGDGTFKPTILYDSGGVDPTDIAIADVNGDGRPDLLVANCAPSNGPGCPGGAGNGNVAVFLGNGDGTFAKGASYDPGGYWTDGIAVADLNGDGKPDVIVQNSIDCITCVTGNVGVMLGNGDGTFQPVVNHAYGNAAFLGFTVGDVNGDGKLDLAFVGGHYAGVMLGNGDGTFQPVLSSTPDLNANTVVIADVDGDGKQDLVASNWCEYNGNSCTSPGFVSVLLGSGSGTFVTVASFSSGGYSLGVAVGDFDGDGRPDVAVANYYFATVGVLLNGGGSFTPTATSLKSSLNPSLVQQSVTFKAKVTSSAGTPTGTVVFLDGSTSIGSVTLTNGTAALATSSLSMGSHQITASYQGGPNLGASVSPPVNQAVNGYPTSTSLISSHNPALTGQRIAYTATVTSAAGRELSGWVVFTANNQNLGTAFLRLNVATLRTSFVDPGSYNITAQYTGDATNASSTSAILSQVVGAKSAQTTTSLISSLNPSVHGQAVTFTATVIPSGALPPTGRVRFLDGTKKIGSGVVSGGVATFTTSILKAGTHAITALYLGDKFSGTSTSAVLNQVVNP